jgi:hypothetical protein
MSIVCRQSGPTEGYKCKEEFDRRQTSTGRSWQPRKGEKRKREGSWHRGRVCKRGKVHVLEEGATCENHEKGSPSTSEKRQNWTILMKWQPQRLEYLSTHPTRVRSLRRIQRSGNRSALSICRRTHPGRIHRECFPRSGSRSTLSICRHTQQEYVHRENLRNPAASAP